MAQAAHPNPVSSVQSPQRPVQHVAPGTRHAALVSPASARLFFVRALHIWHLASLDAPTVAVAWTAAFAHSANVRLPHHLLFATFAAVWLLYAADRLLDARALHTQPDRTSPHSELKARHLTHARHRPLFLAVIALSSSALPFLLSSTPSPILRLYLALAVFLALWLGLVHALQLLRPRNPVALPKELAVGLFFAAATSLPALAVRPAHPRALLIPILLFAALCALNCVFIYAWEHPTPKDRTQAHSTTQLLLSRPAAVALTLSGTAALAAVILVHAGHPQAAFLALATSLASALLRLLHRFHRTLAPTTLRAAADLVLLTPVFLLPLLR